MLKPEKQKDGSLIVYLQMVGCSPDGVQYKPYSSQFISATPIYVAVRVRAEHILVNDASKLILTPQGWFAVARQMATASVLAAGAST